MQKSKIKMAESLRDDFLSFAFCILLFEFDKYKGD